MSEVLLFVSKRVIDVAELEVGNSDIPFLKYTYFSKTLAFGNLRYSSL